MTSNPQSSELKRDRALEQRQARALEVDSPEGRPPSKGARRLSWVVFWIVGAILLITVIVAIATTRSTVAIVIAAALLILYGLATMPVWGATLLRKGEKERVEQRLRKDSEVISR